MHVTRGKRAGVLKEVPGEPPARAPGVLIRRRTTTRGLLMGLAMEEGVEAGLRMIMARDTGLDHGSRSKREICVWTVIYY